MYAWNECIMKKLDRDCYSIWMRSGTIRRIITLRNMRMHRTLPLEKRINRYCCSTSTRKMRRTGCFGMQNSHCEKAGLRGSLSRAMRCLSSRRKSMGRWSAQWEESKSYLIRKALYISASVGSSCLMCLLSAHRSGRFRIIRYRTLRGMNCWRRPVRGGCAVSRTALDTLPRQGIWSLTGRRLTAG